MSRNDRRAKLKKASRKQGKFAAAKTSENSEKSMRGSLLAARQCMRKKQYYEAYKHYRKIVFSPLSTPLLLVEACNPLVQSGALTEIEALVEEGVKQFPDSDIVWCQLGLAKRNIGRHEQSLSAYQHALELEPSSVHAWSGLSQLQERMHQLDESLESIEHAIEVAPQAYLLQHARGKIFHRLGRHADAAKDQKKVLRLAKPQEIELMFYAGAALAEAERGLGNTLAEREARRAAKAVQTPLRETHLAKFTEFKKTNAKRAEGLTQDQARRWFENPILEASHSKQKCAFIVGHPRSGTTLTEQILAAHSRIITLDEREAIANAESMAIGINPTIPILEHATPTKANKFLDAYHKEVHRYLGEDIETKLLIDKRPDSVLMLPTILRMMPASKVIVVIRDPRDVCVSCYEQTFSLGVVSAQFHSIASTCQYYAWFMSHWLTLRKLLPQEMWLEVKYETLVTDFDQTVREMVAFLGLEWDPSVLAFHEKASSRLVSTPSYSAVTQPVSDRAVGRWREYAEEFAGQVDVLAPYLELSGYEP